MLRGCWRVFVVLLLSGIVCGGASRCTDVHQDGFIDLRDFAVFASNFGSPVAGAGDFDDSGMVDANDLSRLTAFWLREVDCPEYFADKLPFSTSFEKMHGFDLGDIDHQQGWEVEAGRGVVDEAVYYVQDAETGQWTAGGMYNYVRVEAGSAVGKDFIYSGVSDRFIRIKLSPGLDSQVLVYDGEQAVLAAVVFDIDGYIYAGCDGEYVWTGAEWSYEYGQLVFAIDWANRHCDVSYDGAVIYSGSMRGRAGWAGSNLKPAKMITLL